MLECEPCAVVVFSRATLDFNQKYCSVCSNFKFFFSETLTKLDQHVNKMMATAGKTVQNF